MNSKLLALFKETPREEMFDLRTLIPCKLKALHRSGRYYSRRKIVNFPIDQLIGTQSEVNAEHVLNMSCASVDALPPIWVEIVEGKAYIAEGHHRLCVSILHQHKTIRAKVRFMEKDEK